MYGQDRRQGQDRQDRQSGQDGRQDSSHDSRQHRVTDHQALTAVHLASSLTLTDLLLIVDTMRFQLQWTREGIGVSAVNRARMQELVGRIEQLVVAVTAAGMAEAVQGSAAGSAAVGPTEAIKKPVTREHGEQREWRHQDHA